jgi:transcriptional regulator GlxA family with amidase domain
MHFDYIEDVLENSSHIVQWIRKQYNRGCEIASICLGAFLLASSGLLDNQNATTHWMGADLFKKKFPLVNLVDDKFITDYQRIYTCGGAYSFTTLMIYIIDKYFGQEVSIIISKVFLIHLHDSKQSSYKILNLQKSHNNNAIKKVQNYIEINSNNQLLVEQLAVKANMSLRTFMRNFKKATGDTPNAYIQKVRMEKAKKLLEKEDIGIEQVCFEVGYSDFTSFRKVFKKIVGLNPSGYKKLYNKAFTRIYVES